MLFRIGVMVTILALGCGGEEAASESSPSEANNPETVQVTPTPVDEAPAAHAAGALEAAQAAVALAERSGIQGAGDAVEALQAPEAAQLAEIGEALAGNEQEQQEGMAAMMAVMAAAQNAQGTPCEQAYSTGQAMFDALPEERRSQPFPERARFLEACGTLPADTQQCMTMTYAMGHAQECMALTDGPDVARLREMMAPAQ